MVHDSHTIHKYINQRKEHKYHKGDFEIAPGIPVLLTHGLITVAASVGHRLSFFFDDLMQKLS